MSIPLILTFFFFLFSERFPFHFYFFQLRLPLIFTPCRFRTRLLRYTVECRHINGYLQCLSMESRGWTPVEARLQVELDLLRFPPPVPGQQLFQHHFHLLTGVYIMQNTIVVVVVGGHIKGSVYFIDH